MVLLNVSESFPELLLACLVIILSICFLRRKFFSTQSTNPQHSEDAMPCVRDHHQSPDLPHVGSSPVQPDQNPEGLSVNVSASSSSTVNSPALHKNIFYGTSNFNFPTSSEKEPKGAEPAEAPSDSLAVQKFLESHKASMKKKTECIFEGKKEAKYRTRLKKVFTELVITEGELNRVNTEHEILKITKDKAFRGHQSQETPIDCNDIFRRNEEPNKTVLTKGIAGIGKTVCVQKFILDWAEGEANQDIDCMFLLPFREINLIAEEEYSLQELLLEFFPELGKVKEAEMFENLKLVFIFDGLDESRLRLDFSGRMVKSIQKKSSVDSLITNLINGNLLPSALIWITSRPVAANQIPSEFVSMFTEVQGFTDKKKEDYFRKRIPDETDASKIISHIKISRSLYIMGHIPVFCWITATVLQKMLLENQEENIPSTLTEMYTHFLLIQMNMKNQKYDKTVERDHVKLMDSNKDLILKLAKLAFEQLKKENVMFYESDLRECGISVTEDSEYAGMCAEIFKQESVLHEKKVYCFIHLSVQEFLAALHVFYSYLSKNMDDLRFFLEDKVPDKLALDLLLKKAVEKAKESKRGHLDLFLRFLMGISHESNQKLLAGLLPCIKNTKKSISNMIQHMKQMLNKDLSPEKSINNFFCLLELKDSSLYNQVRKYLNSEAFPHNPLSRSNCSTLAYILLMSEEVIDELDPKKYNPSNAACRRLIPAVRCCRRALLAGCELNESCCECISAALQSENSPLRELDLSDNYNLETSVNLLCSGLQSSQCKLEILKLARCYFGPKSCAELVSALISITPQLKELDLSNNDLQDSGLKPLLHGLRDSCGKLQILRLSWCNLTEKSCEIISSLLNTSPESSLTELDLSNNDLQHAGIKYLSSGLADPKCILEKLRLSGCMITEDGCSSLASALQSNPSHLTDLDLRYNNPGESGEKLLSAVLEDPNCKVQPRIDPKGEQFIKAGFKKYACRLTLDPNTAHRQLCLSEDNRKVTHVDEKQDYPYHPDRFRVFPHVLCKELLCDRCYWEVEFENSDPEIAVTYPEIERQVETMWRPWAQLGMNHVSWSLSCSDRYHARHYALSTELTTAVPRSGRIGVFLDWPAGVLSFYTVSSEAQTLSHLHTFKTTFKKHLHPAFRVETGSVSLFDCY